MKLTSILKEAMKEMSYKTAKEKGLEHPEKADLDHNKDLNSYELKRGKAIQNAMKKHGKMQNENDDENQIRFGNEVRPLEKLPTLGADDQMAMNPMGQVTHATAPTCQECGAPMMYEDRMCSECGWMDEAYLQENHHVWMAKASLEQVIEDATELLQKLGEQEQEVPAWISDHITNAENYIHQANKGFYFEDEEGEEGEEQGEEDMEMSPEEEDHMDDLNLGEKKQPKKWIQKAIHPSKEGSLKKALGVKKDETIPQSKLDAAAKKGGKLGQRARFAQTLKKLHK